ncbi:MAG: histidine kinase [Deltaproteobacteria bacterium]|nr:histidine kinase [Deltaproteobacteria bacterium]
MEQQYETKFIFKYWSNIKNDLIDFIYVIIICTLLALAITIIGPIKNFLINFIASQSFGITVTSIVFWSLLIIRPRTWELLLFIVVIDVCCSVLIGLQICIFILQYFFNIVLDLQANGLGLQIIIGGMLFSFFGVYFFITKIRLKYRNEIIDQERTRSTAMEKENISANLKLLQAQIEPHFLFNTLSNILSLIDTKPETGKSMLLDLIKYMRTSLSRTLPGKTTLSQEMLMIKAYLNIQKIRMGERLNYKIDVPSDLGQHSFQPMLLQPLVENAIKHGLEPKVEGGEIVIRATQENNILKIEVADTGLGFSDLYKPGFGIANVRERLGLLFGEKGRLTIEENKPHGVRATMEVPVSEL